MALIREEILSRQLRLEGVDDPYARSHELLHRAQRYGNVIEKANRLMTTGPRTRSDVDFVLEHRLGPFSHLHTDVKLRGDLKLRSLDVTIIATLTMSLPPPSGVVGEAFEDYYARHVWPTHLEGARRWVGGTTADLLAALQPKALTRA